MKEHIQGKLVNELRDIAQQYHAHGCLRENIVVCLEKYLKEDEEWKLKEMWQTIETAPKDRTSVIIRSGKIVGEGYFSPSSGHWDLYKNKYWIVHPTHWRPLPEPPKD